MATDSKVPVTRERGSVAGTGFFPYLSLRREMDRLFDDFASGFGRVPTWYANELMPSMNVSETEREIEFTAELPGLEPKDVEVTLSDNILTIRGEKKAEKDETKKDYRLVERSFGSFSRSFEVPGGTDPSAIRASIDKGVLTVTFPKPARAAARKIDVKAAA